MRRKIKPNQRSWFQGLLVSVPDAREPGAVIHLALCAHSNTPNQPKSTPVHGGHAQGAGGTYHSQGEVVEEVVVAFGRDLLVRRGRVDLHLKHTGDGPNDI